MPKDAFTDSEFKLHTIVESTSDGLIVVNKDGVILFFNEAVMFHLGRKREELLGKPFGFPIVVGKLTEIDITRTEADLSGRGIAQMVVVEIEWEKKPAYLITIHDVTELKEAEKLKAEISEYKKLDQLKSEFVGTVSHELRTPLAIIKEGISLVLDGVVGNINEKQKKVLGASKSNIDRLAKIINNLLDISKIEAGRLKLKRSLVDFSHLVKDLFERWKLKSDKKNQTFEVSAPEVPLNIYIDSDQITQTLDNFISNAIKFTPENGKIKVELKDGKDQVEVSVSDTGIGIAKEDLPKVFGKFQQFSRQAGPGEKGTGLGLAICKELVEMHGGKICVESELDKWTKVTITIPKMEIEAVLKEYINNGIKQAADRNTPLLLMVIHIADFAKLYEELGHDKAHNLLKELEEVIKGSLYRRADTVVRNTGELVVLLFDTKREAVPFVKERFEKVIRDYLSKSKERCLKGIHLAFGFATYPDDATNDEELLNHAKHARGAL